MTQPHGVTSLAARSIASLGAIAGSVAALLFLSGCVRVEPAPVMARSSERATDVAAPLQLTEDRSVQLALQNDPLVRAGRSRISAAYWRKVQESLPANPTLYASAYPSEWSVTLAGEIADLLDVGGRRQRRVDAAQSREEQAVVAVVVRQIEVAQTARQSFAELTAAREQEPLLRRKVELLQSALDLGRRQQAAGHLSSLNVLALESDLRAAQVLLADAVTEQQRWEARLNRLLGRPLGAPLTVAATDGMPDGIRAPEHPERLLRLGVARRPEIALVVAKLNEHRANLALAEVAWVPRVNAGPLVTKPGRGEPTVGGGWASIVLPVFDRGQHARRAEAAMIDALWEELIGAEAQVLLDVHLAVIDLRHHTQRRAAAAGQAALAEKTRVVIEQSRERGGASQVDVATAQISELNAMLLTRAAERQLRLAEVGLRAALGDRGDAVEERVE